MLKNSTTASRNGSGGNGFWSNVSSGLGEGLGKIGGQILPIWAAKELKIQSSDQLNQSTFDQNALPPGARLDDQRRTTGESPNQKADDTLLGFDKTAVMIIAGGLTLAGVVFFVSRR